MQVVSVRKYYHLFGLLYNNPVLRNVAFELKNYCKTKNKLHSLKWHEICEIQNFNSGKFTIPIYRASYE